MGDTIHWHDVQHFAIEGKGWNDTLGPFDRLPTRAKSVVREAVWNLSRCAAGICARFVTDSAVLHARWTLLSESLAMSHMAATGVSGVDLYVRTQAGSWTWAGMGRPERYPANESALLAGLPPGEREFMLYLPLYNGATAVAVGVQAGSRCAAGPARTGRRARPVMYYGTSIAQGGCASRPGMAHVAMLGRWLDWPMINLGFSGNGTLDPEVAEFMAEVDVAAYVIDCLPNSTVAQVAERTGPLLQILRRARPATPIILVEDRTATNAPLLPTSRTLHADKRAALRACYDQFRTDDPHLFYQPGAAFMGDDGEGTVDGSHPTDLGFRRQAKAMLPLLRQVLGD